ncbi:MAG: hypothetical protein Q8K96_13965 [Rubrivivax sp.]|nr:hypothetical protein [Rubrivivax sp.]
MRKRWPGRSGDAPAVVWLQPAGVELQAVTGQDRAEQRAYLEGVLAEGMVIDTSGLAQPTADDGHPQGARLCAQCGGRCCEHGGGWRAFIDLTLLQRWRDQHPGRTLVDATAAYVAMLPARHVHGSCLYQSAQGCAIPRELRADICNGFACQALQAVQRLAAADAGAAVVAITFHQDRVERAALIDATATRELELPL